MFVSRNPLVNYPINEDGSYDLRSLELIRKTHPLYDKPPFEGLNIDQKICVTARWLIEKIQENRAKFCEFYYFLESANKEKKETTKERKGTIKELIEFVFQRLKDIKKVNSPEEFIGCVFCENNNHSTSRLLHIAAFAGNPSSDPGSWDLKTVIFKTTASMDDEKHIFSTQHLFV